MTEVRFYHLAQGGLHLTSVICSLVDMAVGKGLDILILSNDETQATAVAEQLETRFQLGALLAVGATPQAVISVCWQATPGHHQGVLINLQEKMPEWFSRFHYHAELICEENADITAKRENYRLCRDRGYPLQYHDLTTDNIGQQFLL